MAGEWRNCRWGDIATLEYGKSLRGYQHLKGCYRVYGTNGPIGWHDEPLCTHPGVIIGRKGAYRGVNYSPEPFYVIDTAFYLEPKQEMDLRWAYYCLLTYNINGMDSGSAIPSTSRDAFYHLPVGVPPRQEQQAIANILGVLDDKIGLNQRINETLEAMARAIFKSWFVDFDPVRAKAEGREPHVPERVADHFPDALEDSDLGPIPLGWKVRALPEFIEINPPRQLGRGVIAAYLDMAHMPTQGHGPKSWVGRAVGAGVKFRNGDTLVAKITPCLENGKTAYVDFLKDSDVGWGSTEYIVLRPRDPIPAVFAYLLARSDGFRTFAIQRMTGSSGRQRVPIDSLKEYRLAIPTYDSAVFPAFGQALNPLFDRMRSAMSQSCTLSQLRDRLLPKLISGVIRAEDAERFIATCL